MASRKSKIIALVILAITVVCSVIFVVGATGTSKDYYKSMSVADISKYRTTPESFTYPEYSEAGYIFAGWFTDETFKEAITKDTVSGPAVAKFVPADVLGVKVQVSKEMIDPDTTNDEYGAIRFLTSVDSLDYSQVGFIFDRGKGEEPPCASNKVYKEVHVVEMTGGTDKVDKSYVPDQVFHAASQYFKSWTYTKVPDTAYNTVITATPFWITLDGTTVRSSSSRKICVNEARQWKYIFVDDTGSDSKGTGTRTNPYATLNAALEHIKEYGGKCKYENYGDYKKDGEIWVLNALTAKEEFAWDSHGLDVTIKGEQKNQASVVDFSDVRDMFVETGAADKITDLIIGDSVTFENMTLSFPARVHANGHRFEIAADVSASNPGTTIFGGAYNESVYETNVTILAGRYKMIVGGGCVGDVETDTHVKVENTDVYDTTSGAARVHGGSNRATVHGSTYVEIGTGFNSNHKDYTSHSKLSAVFGGGYSANASTTSVVEKDTYVTIKEDAKVNYVFGGGWDYSDVLGTCHVIFEGGYAVSVYGGSSHANNKTASNSHTSVVIKDGTVQQVFGGSERKPMEGNTNVQILGGTVERRIFGGCYNGDGSGSLLDDNFVTGITNVTIGSKATISQKALTSSYTGDTSICSVSRLGTNSKSETGIMVVYDADASKYTLGFNELGGTSHADLYTNYLVKVGTGGTVTAESGVLLIVPDKEDGYATVTDTTNKQVLCVLQGEGTYKLSELKDREKVQNIEVTFTKEEPDIVVKNVLNGKTTYYTSLEAAIAAAEDDTTVVVLQDVDVNSAMTVSKNITLTSEDTVTIKRGAEFINGSMFDITGGKFIVQGTAKAQITIDGDVGDSTSINVRAFYVRSGERFKLKYVTVKDFRTTGDGGAVRATESSIIDVQNCKFTENKANPGGALHIAGGVTATSRDSVFTGNISTGNNAGAVYCAGTYTDTNSSYIDNVSVKNGAAVFVINDGNATLTGNGAEFNNNTPTGGSAIFVQNNGSSASVTGYTFKGDTTQTIQVNGTLTFDNITGVTLVDGTATAKGTIYVAGYEAANEITLTPGAYTEGRAVLTPAEGVADDVFKAACEGIAVNPGSGGTQWSIDENGKLRQEYVARIEGKGTYDTFDEALNKVEDGEVIYLAKDVVISAQKTIAKAITITNEPGMDITITRSANVTMFYVTGKLTLGTNDDNEEGQLIVDASVGASTRIVDNRDNATFILGKNATLQNANNSQWGCTVINRNGTVELYGNVINNTCTGDGGAILQHGANGTLTIYGGNYTGNKATKATTSEKPDTTGGLGSVVTVYAGKVEIKDGIFSDNSTVSRGGILHARTGSTVVLSGGTFSNNTAGEGSDIYFYDKLEIAGPITAANGITITPSAYEEKAVLTQAAEVSADVFKAACAGIKVTPSSDGKVWSIDDSGVLKAGAARIGDDYYPTLAEAINNANTSGGTGNAADIVVYVLSDVELSSGLTIKKNIQITNRQGSDITITRSGSYVMFTGASGAKFTLGTIGELDGQLIVDGGRISSRMIDNPAGAIFTLGANATLQNATMSNWGSALINRGTAYLYGNVIGHTNAGTGGAILQYAGELYVLGGIYTGNTTEKTDRGGSAIIVKEGKAYIKGGIFCDNSTLGDGGAIYVYENTTVTISGGIFRGNTAGRNGNAIYVASGGTAIVTGGDFATEEPAQEIYVAGTLKHNGTLPAALIKKENDGTVEETE